MRVGVISDTHSYFDDRIAHHLKTVDLIVHAGDVGDVSVLHNLRSIQETKCVYGNIDGSEVRAQCPEHLFFTLNQVRFLVIHIAGSVGRYNATTRALIKKNSPDVLICGHSHILKVVNDPTHNLLHLNPGAAGRHGFHKVRTLLKFEVAEKNINNLKVIELGPRST
ncbi:MAG: metallophosphoesterase family protein [Salibacteraceae bacterium]